jgi:hypothetical protein
MLHAGSMAQAVEHQLQKCKALSSKPTTNKKKKCPSTQEAEAGESKVQGQPKIERKREREGEGERKGEKRREGEVERGREGGGRERERERARIINQEVIYRIPKLTSQLTLLRIGDKS